MKDGSSLVVTIFSIPSSATCGPDADVSFEGFEDVLEDPHDEPTMKKRVFDSEGEESAEHETKFMGMYVSPYLAKFPLFFFFFYIYLLFIHMYLCHLFLMWSPFILHVYSSNCRDL